MIRRPSSSTLTDTLLPYTTLFLSFPRMPAVLVAMVGTSLAVWAIGLPLETIGSRFGEIPSSLPLPSLPAFSLQQAVEVLPSAFTIAFLAGKIGRAHV